MAYLTIPSSSLGQFRSRRFPRPSKAVREALKKDPIDQIAFQWLSSGVRAKLKKDMAFLKKIDSRRLRDAFVAAASGQPRQWAAFLGVTGAQRRHLVFEPLWKPSMYLGPDKMVSMYFALFHPHAKQAEDFRMIDRFSKVVPVAAKIGERLGIRHPWGIDKFRGQPWGKIRNRVYNLGTFLSLLERHPFPNPPAYFERFWLKMMRPKILAFLDRKIMTEEEFRDFITMSLLDNYEVLAGQINDYLKKQAKKKKKRAIIRAVIGLVVSIVMIAIAPAAVLSIYNVTMTKLSLDKRRRAARSLKQAAKQFRKTDAAFAAELDRLAAKFDAEAAAEEEARVLTSKEEAAQRVAVRSKIKTEEASKALDAPDLERPKMALRSDRKPLESPLVRCPWIETPIEPRGMGMNYLTVKPEITIPGLDGLSNPNLGGITDIWERMKSSVPLAAGGIAAFAVGDLIPAAPGRWVRFLGMGLIGYSLYNLFAGEAEAAVPRVEKITPLEFGDMMGSILEPARNGKAVREAFERGYPIVVRLKNRTDRHLEAPMFKFKVTEIPRVVGAKKVTTSTHVVREGIPPGGTVVYRGTHPMAEAALLGVRDAVGELIITGRSFDSVSYTVE